MGEALIRGFHEGDREAWEALWEGYNTFYKRTIEQRVTERLWPRLVSSHGKPYGFAAELDGKVVGFAHYFFVFSTSDWHPRCYLQDLFTNPDVRGRGVGRKLIEAVSVEADRNEAAQTYWLTHETNATARRLYDRVARNTGFVKYSI